MDAHRDARSAEEGGNAPGRRRCGRSALSAEASQRGRGPWTASNAARFRVEGAVPAPSPLRCVVFLHSIAGRTSRRTERFLGGTVVPGSRFTVWCWSGNRTRDRRNQLPMLYPSELSSGGRTGFEPVANGLRRCSASELPSARGAPSPTLRHTPRQRRAHRTGQEPVPLSRVRSMLRIAGCRQPAIRSGAMRPCGVHSPRRSRRSITTRRTCAGRSRAPASGRAGALPGCSRAERNFRGGMDGTWSMHAHPPRTLKTKRPRVWRPEGVRVPREIGVADLPGSQPDVRSPGAVRVRYRAGRCRSHAAPGRSAMAAGRACCRRNRRASWKNSLGEKTATRATGADNTPLACEAQHFFDFIFDGRSAAPEGCTSGCR